MRTRFFLIALYYFFYLVHVQAQTIDSLPVNWPNVSSLVVSDNGEIISYELISSTVHDLVIKDVTGNEIKEVTNSWGAAFCGKDKYLIFSTGHDSMAIFNCINFNITYYSKVKRFYCDNNSQNIVYEIDSAVSKCVMENIVSGKKKVWMGYTSSTFSENGNVLLLYENNTIAIDRRQYRETTIEKLPGNIQKMTFSPSFDKIAFSIVNPSDVTSQLVYLKNGLMDKARQILNSDAICNNKGVFDIEDLNFSRNYSKLFVKYSQKKDAKRLASIAKVWNTADKHLVSEIEASTQQTDRIFQYGVVNLENNRYVPLTDTLYNGSLYNVSESVGDYCLLRTHNNWSEEGWDKSVRSAYYIISLENGKKYELVKDSLISDIQLSPSGKYVVYFNREDFYYYTFDLSTFTKRKLDIKSNRLFYNDDDDINGYVANYGVACWSENEEKVYVYDRFDIWEFDVRNRTTPVNITAGYGKENTSVLRFIKAGQVGAISSVHQLNNDLLLSVFSLTTKEDGFACLRKDFSRGVQTLSHGAVMNFFPITTDLVVREQLIKAKYRDIYIFKSMSYDKYPNYVLTKDFKKFKNISELAPHKHYTWYNARLLKYKVNNRDAEGIIYTPSDFDSTKKYPVIFNIYEKLSNYLNRFIYPALSDGRLNVPYFVNKGYVVFEPNINYNMGSPGEDALSSILAGFNYISQFKWVDTAKCGIQGISWGGYEINYTLTKTNIFKAASVSAGVSDLVSSYNSLRAGQGISAQFHAESGQGRMGISLWQDHEKYIENSPILFADKVTTPVLIEHNRGDEAVPYTQGLEWFLALRRLNKKAWLVEYENEGHGINNVANRYDFTEKLTQFFDYYLKGKEMPEWMEHEIAL